MHVVSQVQLGAGWLGCAEAPPLGRWRCEAASPKFRGRKKISKAPNNDFVVGVGMGRKTDPKNRPRPCGNALQKDTLSNVWVR